MTTTELQTAVEATQTRENEIFDFITYNGIATTDEATLVTNINGYTEEILNKIIYARTGYHSMEQAITCEPGLYETPLTDEQKEDHKAALLKFIKETWKGETREKAAEDFYLHGLIGEAPKRRIFALLSAYSADHHLHEYWWTEFFDDADDIYRELY